MKRTLIQNAVIVNEGRKVLGSVVIENEKIAEILVGEEKATAPCDEVIDASSNCELLSSWEQLHWDVLPENGKGEVIRLDGSHYLHFEYLEQIVEYTKDWIK